MKNETKVCTRCKEEKHLSFFYDSITRCKQCKIDVATEWNKKNKVRRKIIYTKSRHKHIDKGREAARVYYNNNKERFKVWAKKDIVKTREIKRRSANKATDTLKATYLKSRAKKMGFSKESVDSYPEILKLIKIIIKTKRLCKT